MGTVESPRPNTDPADRSVEEVVEAFMGGVRAGYYHMDSPAEQNPQEIVPFINNRCGDCEFLTHGTCLVKLTRRAEEDTTCRYFDEVNKPEALTLFAEKNEETRQKFVEGGFQWGSAPEQNPSP